ARARTRRQAEPERAALGGEADRAGGEAARCEPRVESNGRRGDAEAVGAEQTDAMSADEREQTLLPLRPFAARFGEAGRDDDERANARRERLLCRVEHQLSWETDNSEVDGIGNLAHRAVAVDAGDRVAVAVHRVDGTGEIAGEDVAEELAADRAAALRGSDDGNGVRLEERLERRPHRDVIALGHVLAVGVGRRDREPNLE